MLKALRSRSISLLWAGQALSSIGDEIYRVALIWIAVGLIGADTGYLSATQCAATIATSLIVGGWADRWDPFHTMIRVDLLRAMIVLVPVTLHYFMPVSLPILWVTAFALAALSPVFDPALQTLLPRFSPDRATLQAATGIMSTTLRLARVVGPLIIGVLTTLIPTIHFFTLDSLTFAVSAFSILMLRRHPTIHRKPAAAASPTHAPQSNPSKMTLRESLASGFRAIQDSPLKRYVLFSKGAIGGAWSLAYTLGFALLAHNIAPHDARRFGLLIATYGIGNLSAALVLGNMQRKNTLQLMFMGYVWNGTGFILVALAPTPLSMALAAAFCGAGGVINDLPFTDWVQQDFPLNEVPKIFRLRIALETSATLATMAIAPALFHRVAVRPVLELCGSFILACGLLGFLRFSSNRAAPQHD